MSDQTEAILSGLLNGSTRIFHSYHHDPVAGLRLRQVDVDSGVELDGVTTVVDQYCATPKLTAYGPSRRMTVIELATFSRLAMPLCGALGARIATAVPPRRHSRLVRNAVSADLAHQDRPAGGKRADGRHR